MAKCTFNINGRTLRAPVGETLVNAALMGKVVVPHDCCSGQCETCRVRVVYGQVDDCGTAYGDTVLACQSVLKGDATITFESVPDVTTCAGEVSEVRSLAPDILEVVVRLKDPLAYRPGQYVSVRFSGFPPRDYSPTVRLHGESTEGELVLHVKRFADGQVSSRIGREILPGHRLRIRGPFGRCFLHEPRPSERLVLASQGTGFAPIWAIARDAVLSGRQNIVVVAGALNPQGVYFRSALSWLRNHGASAVKVSVRDRPDPGLLQGPADLHLPSLDALDAVHAAGSPRFIGRMRARAEAAGARLFIDSFTPAMQGPSLTDRLQRHLRIGFGSLASADAGLLTEGQADC